MFSAINRAEFDFQKEGTHHYQIHHNELCKSLSLMIHKTNHNTLTCAFLLSLNQTQQRIQGTGMIIIWQFFNSSHIGISPEENLQLKKYSCIICMI